MRLVPKNKLCLNELKALYLIPLLLIALLLLSLISGCNGQEAEKETKKEKKTQFPTKIEADFPTGLVFTNDKLFFIEKDGRLKVLEKGEKDAQTLFEVDVPSIAGYNETGLLGIALDPDFDKNQKIFLYHTISKDKALENQVIRIQADKPDVKPKVILRGIQGARIHNGGKLAFGPENDLFIATGDSDRQELAQNTESLNGKVLRVEADGSIPEGNPFSNAVYSYGHRNIFGMAFDTSGTLIVTENGPVGDDEINKIIKGANYGWPQVTGFSDDFEQPLIVFDKAIAPTGIIFYTGSKFSDLKNKFVFADFNNGDIHKLTLENGSAKDEIIATNQGQINDLAKTKDGSIYVTTENEIKELELSK